uniref:Hcy-binding domain-containing protein n=1 Tax=Bos mutus grunniens TaxID=30521 RepID=A0A8B9WQK6_BOSMU
MRWRDKKVTRQACHLSLKHLTAKQRQQWEAVNTAACDLAREVADKGDALVAGGICRTSLYAHHKDEVRIKKLFRLQLEIFARKNVDFLIAEYFEHAVEVLKESGEPVAATMCIGPEGDMHGVTPGECAVKLVKAGASVVGVNCRFGPWTSLKTMSLRKEARQAAELKAPLMVWSLGFHMPDCGKGGFLDLPEYPFVLQCWSPELQPDGIFKRTPEKPTTWGSGT